MKFDADAFREAHPDIAAQPAIKQVLARHSPNHPHPVAEDDDCPICYRLALLCDTAVKDARSAAVRAAWEAENPDKVAEDAAKHEASRQAALAALNDEG